MLRDRKLARSIADMAGLNSGAGSWTSRRDLAVIVTDRWYPSSNTCSGCGHVLETLTLAQRN